MGGDKMDPNASFDDSAAAIESMFIGLSAQPGVSQRFQ
jgi:hypothetical protein